MRNQRIDLFKCVAIYSVVFLHIKNGQFDWSVTGLTRYAVPFFFLVAGYFACEQRGKKLLRRAVHLFFQFLLTLGVVMALCAAMVLRNPGASVLGYIRGQFTAEGWWDLLAFQVPPFPYSYHVWFIASMPLLYLIWWGVTELCRRTGRTVPYRALAVLAVVLLGVHLCLEEGLAILGREPVPPKYMRNAWMDGLPFFLLGAWMHHDEAAINSLRLSKGVVSTWLILYGALALVEQCLAGYQDLFLANTLFALLLMGAALKWPEVKQDPVRRWMCRCGQSMTFLIYAVHVPLYYFFLEWKHLPLFGWIIDHQLISPLIVAVLSTGIAMLILWGKRFFYSIFQKHRL